MRIAVHASPGLSLQRPLWLEDGWRTAWGRKGWLAFLAVLVILAAALSVKLPAYMRVAALSVANHGVFPDYAWATALAVALGVAIVAWPFDDQDKARLLLLWAAKAVLTLLVLPIYEAHYTALDARMYFSIGTGSASNLPPLIYGIGTSVTIWLVHWATDVLPGYFHVLEMLWSFVGLLAIYAFYRGWRWIVPTLNANFLLWVGLFPGIIFWSSILGKDPPVLFGIGLYFYAVAKWSATRKPGLLALAAGGVLVASAVRPWLAVILVGPLVAFPLTGRQLRSWQKVVLLAIVAAGGFYAARVFLGFFKINDLQNLIQTGNKVGHSWAHGGSALHFSRIPGLGGLLRFLPLGMFTALFRPLPGEVMNAFGLIAGVINAGLLLLAIRAVYKAPLRILRSPTVLWIMLLILIWAAMYALPSSQNLGTASRFRLEVLPVLWPLIKLFSAVSKRKILQKEGPAEQYWEAHFG